MVDPYYVPLAWYIIIWRNGWFVPSAKIMYTISYSFNITLVIIIIVKNYLNSFMSIYVCFPRCCKITDRALWECITNFSVDPYYVPLAWYMIWRNGWFVPSVKNHVAILFLNITLLIVIIIKDYLSGFMIIAICLLSNMLQNL